MSGRTIGSAKQSLVFLRKRTKPFRGHGNQGALSFLPGEALERDDALAQRWRLLTRLQRGTIDTISARRELNIMMPAARIKELRNIGFSIQTLRRNILDDKGRLHLRVAVYQLRRVGASDIDEQAFTSRGAGLKEGRAR